MYNLGVKYEKNWITSLALVEAKSFTVRTKMNKTGENSVAPVTLGSLYRQDLEEAYFLSHFPPSQVAKKWTYFAVLGWEFPLISEQKFNPFLAQHWSKQLPEYPKATTIRHTRALQDDRPIITVFPMQDSIPIERHAVDPKSHYNVLLKSAIQDMNVRHPSYMARDNITFPAMVKVDQSYANHGNIPVYNKEQLDEALQHVTQHFGEHAAQHCVISELIRGSKKTYCCHFYINSNRQSTWLGATTNITNNLNDEKSVSDWNEDEALQGRFCNAFMVPVGNYLHEKGYFGWVCLDIVAGPHGDYYLVDVNARLAGSTQHVLLATHFYRKLGYSKGCLLKSTNFFCTSEELLFQIDALNENDKGKIIVGGILPGKTDGCCSAMNISVFAKTTEDIEQLLKMPQLMQ